MYSCDFPRHKAVLHKCSDWHRPVFVCWQLLEEICAMGMDPKCICQKSQPKAEPNLISIRSPQPTDNGSSDEEDEEEELANTQDSAAATSVPKPPTPPETPADTNSQWVNLRSFLPKFIYLISQKYFPSKCPEPYWSLWPDALKVFPGHKLNIICLVFIQLLMQGPRTLFIELEFAGIL